MKSVKTAGSDSDDELTSGTQASSDQGCTAPPSDPSALGIRLPVDEIAEPCASRDQPTAGTNGQMATEPASSTPSRITEIDSLPEELSSSGQDADDELETAETMGQLVQRHRRVCPRQHQVQVLKHARKSRGKADLHCRSSSSIRSV